jgi:hydrocephalus-inducing protein
MASASDNYDGIEVPINIRFEPSSLLESKALLTVSNNEGGEYQCLLIGYGLSPQPKGPFKIAGAKPPPIDFKNPFFESMDFIIRIDNPSFTSSLKSPIKIEVNILFFII